MIPKQIRQIDADHLDRKKNISSEIITGIYFLFDGDNVIYVGRSEHVHRRICQHKSNPLQVFDSFSFVEVMPQHLSHCEEFFIRKYKPKNNVIKEKTKVVRHTITLAKEKDDALAKQARRKGMAVPTYFSQLLSEFAEVKIKTAEGA